MEGRTRFPCFSNVVDSDISVDDMIDPVATMQENVAMPTDRYSDPQR